MNDRPPMPPPGADGPPAGDGAGADGPVLGGGFAPPPGPPPGPPLAPPTGPPLGPPLSPPPGPPLGPRLGYPAPPPASGVTAPTGFGAPTPRRGTSNGLAIGALVCGITGVTTSWMCGLGAIPGVTAVVLGTLALAAARRQDDRNGRGLAMGGVVTGAIAIVASVGFVIAIGLGSSTDPVDGPGGSPSTFPSAVDDEYQGGINTDPADGTCDQDRFLQDPDCQGEIFTGGLNSDTPDGVCDQDRFMQDPDC